MTNLYNYDFFLEKRRKIEERPLEGQIYEVE